MISIYDGDILIQRLTDADYDGNYDVVITNGQPEMTRGFDTAVLLAVHGDKNTWQNALARKTSEKYISDFPDVLARGVVTEEVKNDGVAALRRALQFFVDEGIASKVEVAGQITSVFGISWGIDIVKKDGTTAAAYRITYDKNKWAANWKSYE